MHARTHACTQAGRHGVITACRPIATAVPHLHRIICTEYVVVFTATHVPPQATSRSEDLRDREQYEDHTYASIAMSPCRRVFSFSFSLQQEKLVGRLLSYCLTPCWSLHHRKLPCICTKARMDSTEAGGLRRARPCRSRQRAFMSKAYIRAHVTDCARWIL